MRIIDTDHWERKNHFAFFQGKRRPQVEVTTRVAVTDTVLHRARLKASGQAARLSDMLYHLAARAANGIPEFRMRIVDRRPVEFSAVHPAFTYIPAGQSLHSNCIARYSERFAEFAARIEAARLQADQRPSLTPAGVEKQDLLYLTMLPGIAFTSFSNPWGDPDEDSVPRITFGKVVEPAPRHFEVPVSVEALHSFIDGRHFQAFFEALAGLAAHAETTFA